MSRPLFTGSGAERALACPASQALPWVVDEPSEPAELGTAIHAFLARVNQLRQEDELEHARDKALLELERADLRAACAVLDVAALPQLDPAGYAAEVAFAYDVETGAARELGRNLGRAYPALAPSEVPVTVDTVGLTSDGRGVFIGDWKTGHKRVTRARDNVQLLLGALAACRAYGRMVAHVKLSYVRPDEEPFVDGAFLADWDIDDAELRLRAGAAAVRHARQLVAAGQDVELVEGDHCTFCPARRRCPAKVAMVHAVTSAPASWREDARQLLTPERAAEARRRLKLAKSALHMVEVELEAYASEVGGIDMGDGVVYGPRRTVRENVLGPVVHDVLTRLHGRDIADRAVTFEATKSGIEEALRKVVQDTPGAKLAPLNRQALELIRTENGVVERVIMKIDEHRPRRNA